MSNDDELELEALREAQRAQLLASRVRWLKAFSSPNLEDVRAYLREQGADWIAGFSDKSLLFLVHSVRYRDRRFPHDILKDTQAWMHAHAKDYLADEQVSTEVGRAFRDHFACFVLGGTCDKLPTGEELEEMDRLYGARTTSTSALTDGERSVARDGVPMGPKARRHST